jgi:hypothetical protein
VELVWIPVVVKEPVVMVPPRMNLNRPRMRSGSSPQRNWINSHLSCKKGWRAQRLGL